MLALPSELTLHQARGVAEDLLPRLQAAGPGAVRLQASAVCQIDSSALAVLLACQRAVAARGGRLEIEGAPDRLVQLARLYGVAELLGLAPAA